ncbi:MaoC family dehydratase N-terminal domain-containing protein [Nocardia cyriacigeorgica]|uniref:fused (3R)-hydroxyacyl-ACP dehydratase subunits HadA/HadB n=1 Tax=Nocardia cyriacigeorgica TaxID=135487 RepID=UPI0018963876|nr:fused (3R)-hydroxyacyl-ACP dehydratase subunits HadA/HadB [Nocardia cyriacigeorgica]MBF6098536.1 MaoC family dehydratase N-terminal domain-containing protein [Nocardia cyriacigeorgica]MBF6320162.1 MaoC family dehydratase N-terminal domain-containing protein [Nocardia cyriacigeorgica]MBF6346717.1 MaoC family dehydratase N-terminal domain-containing protein [Nocardia cyriacigeorgica]MBF6535438.1 MaoC family dehydratase N-terminal domain-containing protein [Nocardia cyriacigeorgica]
MNHTSTTASAQAAALVGRHYRMVDHYEVGREKIREFARAVQDAHPAHWREDAAAALGYDALIAPLTFPSVVWMQMQRAMFEAVLTGYDISQVLQTEQTIRMYRPLVAGDRLRCDAYVESFRQFGDKDFMVTRNVLSDEHKEVVQVAHTTVVAVTGAVVADELAAAVDGVIMSGHSRADRVALAARRAEESDEPAVLECFDELTPAEPQPARPSRARIRFDDVAVGDTLPTRTVALSRGDLVNYAGVSGDSNPIHYSDRVAHAAGLPDVVSHGLLTMGLGAGYVTEWLDDPAAVTYYGVRFAGFAPIEATRAGAVEFQGRIKALDPIRRSATVAITATCGGRKLFGRATAEVLLR